MINMYFNATPSRDEQGYYNLMIESNNRNINNYIVEILRNDTEEVIWKSPIIEPNHYIKKAKLWVNLPKGETKCRVVFHGYSRENNAYLGSAVWNIKIYS